MQLYLSVFISGYENAKDKKTYVKFQEMVNNLREISKDFWFFDNDPTPFDVSYSQRLKESYLRRGKKVPVGLIYNEDPFERLSMLRNYKVN